MSLKRRIEALEEASRPTNDPCPECGYSSGALDRIRLSDFIFDRETIRLWDRIAEIMEPYYQREPCKLCSKLGFLLMVQAMDAADLQEIQQINERLGCIYAEKAATATRE